MERKKTAFLHAHAVQLLLWTWYPADYNEEIKGGQANVMRAPAGKCDEVLQEEKTHVRKNDRKAQEVIG